MNLIHAFNKISLIKRIVAGLILGAVLGFAFPQLSFIKILGALFVGALKSLAPLLVFFLVIHSLAQHKSGSNSNMSTVIKLYLIGTFSAALVAVIANIPKTANTDNVFFIVNSFF